MRKLIFCFSIILFFSCKENPKELEVNSIENDTSIEKAIPSSEDEVEYEKQIIPGKRIGKIALNENATALLDSLGQPDFGDAAMGKAISTWHQGLDNQLTLYTTMKMGVEDFSRIKAIRSLSSEYKTKNNIGVNSSLKEIEKYFTLQEIGKLPLDGKRYSLYLSDEGIGFEIGNDHKCHGVVIIEKGGNPTQTYLSLYPDVE